jgi:hypothetical protein
MLGNFWKKIIIYAKVIVAQMASMLKLYISLVQTKRISIHHIALAAASAVSKVLEYSADDNI